MRNVESSARVVLLLSAAAIVVGSYGPWAHHPSGRSMDDLYGMDGHGIYVATGGALVALFAVIRKYLGSMIIAAAVTLVGVATYAYARNLIDSGRSRGSGSVDWIGGSIAWGLVVVIGGGVGASVAAAICRREQRTPWGAPARQRPD